MSDRDVKAECNEELQAIARNKKFWEGHISHLRAQGVSVQKDQIEWVQTHLEGLESLRKGLETLLKTIGS